MMNGIILQKTFKQLLRNVQELILKNYMEVLKFGAFSIKC
jgi:hypothetical protein